MKLKALLLFFEVFFSLTIVYLASRYVADLGPKPRPQEWVTALVAKQNLSMEVLITDPERLFEEKRFARGEEPEGAVRSLGELEGRRLNKPIAEGQFVTADDLISSDSMGRDRGASGRANPARPRRSRTEDRPE
jgi:hypothetical protein